MKSSDEKAEGWSLLITAEQKWWNINWPELWRYRDLILLFVRRDFVAYYKQTILGPIWFILQPAMTTLVFTIAFGKIAHISTDNVPRPLFYMSGLLAWNYFAACLNGTANTFVSNAQVFGKVYFPRLCVPIAIVISNLLQLLIQSLLYAAFFIFYALRGGISVHPSPWICLLPLVIMQMAVLGLGCGILVSSLTTKYRDLSLAVTFGVQLWLYATPIIYPLSQIPEHYRWVYALNPMVEVVEFFRMALLGVGGLNFEQAVSSIMVTFSIFTIGLILFHRVEKSFMDTV